MNWFTHTHAVPLLKSHDAAFVTFNCLTSSPHWKSSNMYDAESVLLHKPDDLARALNVRFDGYIEDDSTPDTFYMGDYYRWKSAGPRPRAFDQLLSKAELAQWLYALFLHIALPASRKHENTEFGASPMVWKSLNLTAFLRLLMHLHTIGYPAHWLGQVLANILKDDVVTSARPPIKCPIDLDECLKRRDMKKMSTSAFVAELSTLTAMFSRVLPFAVIVREGVIPHLENVRECTSRFKEDTGMPMQMMDAIRADWVLVFMNLRKMFKMKKTKDKFEEEVAAKLRDVLMDETLLKQMERGIHVVSTWTWNAERKEAKFWMREDVLRHMRDEEAEWRVEVWRTDAWFPLNVMGPFKRKVEWEIGRGWADVLLNTQD